MDVLSWRLRSHQLIIWRIKRDARGAVGFQGAVGGSRPLVAASNLAKTLNKVSNVGRGFIPLKVSKLAS
ncbi:hypothetical protein D9T18_13180 [Pseudoalteromonas agarivorans]|uniref:Uncharacterized protein n=1 Tax=Pseudoalteromonas agarivorans TaxID=176102 RepID=A0AAD0XDS8_9GAMM|nr:hypothetical protein D9T18_13180 [Pseudoalteromonas agarivorans]